MSNQSSTTAIKSDAVIRLFENNLLDYSRESGRSCFTYTATDGFSMQFTADWFDPSPDKEYSLASVRSMMKKLVDAAEGEENIQKFMKDKPRMDQLLNELKAYGMLYDQDTDVYFFAENDKIKFFVDLDYIIALLVGNPGVDVKLILDGMKESSEK